MVPGPKLLILPHGTLSAVRILVDYRPALRARTGVGEYIHQMVRAYTATQGDEVAVFSSSWKDRPAPGVASDLGVQVIDRRVPVGLLNYLWHRREWPPIEALAGACDIAHAAHPLLSPARRAAQVVTIHDLFFLAEPQRTSAEIRRDYVPLAASHARRAHAVITSTAHGKALVIERLGAAADRVYVCPAGAPAWTALGHQPNVPADGYALFLGTLEPRKNIGALLDAWELLLRRNASARLVLAGRAAPEAEPWLQRLVRPPLAGRVTHVGYVAAEERERLYAGARLLVLPSLDEGFGLTALEAMSAGVPLLASNRGSLPEVGGNAAVFIDPTDVSGIADALERLLTDSAFATERAAAGLVRAQAFDWTESAQTLHRAYVDAVARKRAEAGRAHRD
jgi:glycosyltransferase involved in cell wall biosynthesis